MATVRVPGLVRNMNEVRQMLSLGLHPSQVPELQEKVRSAVRDVDRICRRMRVSPRALPGPSRQAYRYLAGLDLNNLPLSPDDRVRAHDPVRVANLITVRNLLREELSAVALSGIQNRGQVQGLELILSDVHGYILDNVAEVATICYQAGATAAALPEPSKRAYQWLSYLAEWDHLVEHYRTLEQALGFAPWASIGLYNIAGLYHAWREGTQLGLTMSEAFCGAPRTVIESLVKLALPYTKRRKYEAVIREYASDEAFERSPILSLRRRITMPFRVPSGRHRGSRKQVSPPGAWARTRNTSDIGAEQNHLCPVTRYSPLPLGRATLVFALTSEPPCFSVMAMPTTVNL